MPNAIYTQDEFKFARLYLDFGPIEPSVGGLKGIAIEPFQINASQISLLNIWAFFKYQCTTDKPDLVFFSHGMVTNQASTTGLSLVIDNKHNKPLTKSVVEYLLNDNNLPAATRRAKLGLSPNDMKMIDNFLMEVQVRSIHHLAFRACNIGNDPDYLLKIARLFNAKFVSAPTQRDFFTKADCYRISQADMDQLIEMGSKLKSFEEKAAEIARAKGRRKAQIVQSGLTAHGSGQHRFAIFIQKDERSHSKFHALAFATTPQAVNNFYRDRFDLRKPMHFTENDYFGDVSVAKQPPGMIGRTLGLFGISRGPNDVIKFPRDAAYTQLIKVVRNEHYIGDLPMYLPPIDEDDLIDLNLRQRLARRVKQVLARN